MRSKIVFTMVIFTISVFLAACSTGSAQGTNRATAVPASSLKPSIVEVRISGFAFDPATLTIKVGTEVKWTNLDSAPHNIASDSGSELASPMIAQNQSWSHVFTTPGTYTYHCGVHPSMKATITVTP